MESNLEKKQNIIQKAKWNVIHKTKWKVIQKKI